VIDFQSTPTDLEPPVVEIQGTVVDLDATLTDFIPTVIEIMGTLTEIQGTPVETRESISRRLTQRQP
jgi:hypothetical protein